MDADRHVRGPSTVQGHWHYPRDQPFLVRHVTKHGCGVRPEDQASLQQESTIRCTNRDSEACNGDGQFVHE